MRIVTSVLNLVAIASIGILTACGAPAEGVLKETIKTSVERLDPVPPWVCGRLVGCRQAQIRDVQLVEIGPKQGSGPGQFWPVRAKLEGACASVFTGGEPLILDKDRIVVFHVSKDEFGKWIAEAQVQ